MHAFAVANESAARALIDIARAEERVFDNVWMAAFEEQRGYIQWPRSAIQGDAESDVRDPDIIRARAAARRARQAARQSP